MRTIRSDIARRFGRLLGSPSRTPNLRVLRKTQILGSFLLVLIVGFGVFDLARVLANPSYVVPWIGYVFLLTSFVLNRWISHRFAAIILMSMFPLVVFYGIISGLFTHAGITLNLLVLGTLVGSFFFSAGGIVLYAAVSVVGIIALPYFVPPAVASGPSTSTALTLNVFSAFLVVLFRMYRDQTAKEDQHELLKREELYRSIFESVHDAVFLGDAVTGRIIGVNRRATELFGYGEDEMLSMSPARFISGEAPYTGRVARAYIMKAHDGRAQVFEWKARRRDGTTFWVDVTVRNATIGGELRIVVSVRDISDRKRVEAEKAMVDRRFRSVWDQSIDGMRIIDESGTIVDVNAAYGRIVGRPIGELRGRPFWDVYRHDSNGKRCEGVQLFEGRIRSRSLPRDEIVKVVFWDGTPRWLSVSSSFLTFDHSSVLVLSIFRDVTHLKEQEEQVLRLNEELERRVQERTSALQTALKELEAFSYSVSHDLRAPLRHISGYATMARERFSTHGDADGDKYLDIVSQSAVRLGLLIDQLLAFSRIGRYTIKRKLVDVREMVEEVRRELEGDMIGRSIDWDVPDLPFVPADPVLLKQAFVNLIANAVKFTRNAGHPRIAVGCEVSGSEYVCSVRDNGAGFDMEHADKLFGVFQRLHKDDEYEGTGIGLANVKRIVQRHGGRVWAESDVGAGASFFFTLPFGREQIDADVPTNS